MQWNSTCILLWLQSYTILYENMHVDYIQKVLMLFFTSSIIIYNFFYNYLQVLLPLVPKQILEVVHAESHHYSNAGLNLGPWFWHLIGLSWLILDKLYHCEHEIEYQHISFQYHVEHHSFCFAKRLFHV